MEQNQYQRQDEILVSVLFGRYVPLALRNRRTKVLFPSVPQHCTSHGQTLWPRYPRQNERSTQEKPHSFVWSPKSFLEGRRHHCQEKNQRVPRIPTMA